MKKHRYTAEQIEFIRSIANGSTVKDIQGAFNAKFDTDVTFKSIKGVMYRNKIKNHMQGYNTRFKNGHKTWNKNKKGLQLGGEKGWFKKGNTNQRLPIGSERINDGRVYIKTANPDVWEEKHRWLWKEHFGEIPDGKIIAFKDGNKLNVTIDNLFITTPGARVAVVRRELPEHAPDLKLASHRLAELDIAIKKSTEKEMGK